MNENILPFQTKELRDAYEYLGAKNIQISCHQTKRPGLLIGSSPFGIYDGWCFHFEHPKTHLSQMAFIPNMCEQREIIIDRMYVDAADTFRDYE